MSLFCQDSIRLATALVLLIAIGISAWVELQFPAWILAVSIEILAGRPPAAATGTQTPPRLKALPASGCDRADLSGPTFANR